MTYIYEHKYIFHNKINKRFVNQRDFFNISNRWCEKPPGTILRTPKQLQPDKKVNVQDR